LAHSRNPEDIAWTGIALKGIGKRSKARSKRSGGKLTDDDLTAIDGQRDQLEGRLQQRYGYAKDQARKDVDMWFSTLK
jgi:uncharacterized protein YjbJ (UPF0337 family)